MTFLVNGLKIKGTNFECRTEEKTQAMRMEINQEQRQIISPVMIQTLGLVMMPGMELKEKLEEEAKVNPVIKLEKKKPDYSRSRVRSKSSGFDSQAYLENMSVYDSSLYKYMMEQVKELPLSEEEKHIAGVILSSVNDNGLLQKPDEKGMMRPIPLEEFLDNGKIKAEDFEKVRRILMYSDPVGVAAFDSRECLEVQAKVKFGVKSLEYRILHEYAELLEKKLFTKLSKELGVSFDKIQETIENISTLNMVPAAGFSNGYSQYIVPDAYVSVDEKGIHLTLNDDYIPEIRLNKQYIDLYNSEEFKGKRISLSSGEKSFLKENIESAKALIENLRSRKEIIFKVILKIMEKQKDYFLKGHQYQIPLKLKDIADELSIHESTVSRVVREKYIQTNKGMIPLKSFFSSNVGNLETSSKSVKEILKTFIDAEDKDDPLSDDRIVQILKKKGLQLSRRTVAKYRAEMNIPPAFMRRNPK